MKNKLAAIQRIYDDCTSLFYATGLANTGNGHPGIIGSDSNGKLEDGTSWTEEKAVLLSAIQCLKEIYEGTFKNEENQI